MDRAITLENRLKIVPILLIEAKNEVHQWAFTVDIEYSNAGMQSFCTTVFIDGNPKLKNDARRWLQISRYLP